VQTIAHVVGGRLILCYWGVRRGGRRKMMMEKRTYSNIFVSITGHLQFEDMLHAV
jgi:hypothetical protein